VDLVANGIAQVNEVRDDLGLTPLGDQPAAPEPVPAVEDTPGQAGISMGRGGRGDEPEEPERPEPADVELWDAVGALLLNQQRDDTVQPAPPVIPDEVLAELRGIAGAVADLGERMTTLEQRPEQKPLPEPTLIRKVLRDEHGVITGIAEIPLTVIDES
jgi:hypothetical protein